MTLDEAIKHCEEKADELNKEVLNQANLCNAREMAECQECAREHEQLAGWLKELKAYRESPKGDLISREALLKAMEEERKYLLARGQKGAEHILVHHCLPLIDNAPTVEAVPLEHHNKIKGIMDNEIKSLVDILDNERPQSKWGKWVISEIRCPNCLEYFQTDCYSTEELKKCPSCGADMKGEHE